MDQHITEVSLPDDWSLEITSRFVLKVVIDELAQPNTYQVNVYLVNSDEMPVMTLQLNILKDSIEFVDIDTTQVLNRLTIGQNKKIALTLA